jgi:hypothetical protein
MTDAYEHEEQKEQTYSGMSLEQAWAQWVEDNAYLMEDHSLFASDTSA